ncbi:hypothetical protein RZS08_01400, partial [Arthrospira platensis SPKY1]|nr:hypothetical protein [Arthrospira platensis SPKY1]
GQDRNGDRCSGVDPYQEHGLETLFATGRPRRAEALLVPRMRAAIWETSRGPHSRHTLGSRGLAFSARPLLRLFGVIPRQVRCVSSVPERHHRTSFGAG